MPKTKQCTWERCWVYLPSPPQASVSLVHLSDVTGLPALSDETVPSAGLGCSLPVLGHRRVWPWRVWQGLSLEPGGVRPLFPGPENLNLINHSFLTTLQ